MPADQHTRALRAAIAQELADLQRQIANAVADNPPLLEPEPTRRIGTGVRQPGAPDIVQALDTRVERLEQVRDWIDEDEPFAHLIDSVITQQVRAAERRQARLNVILSTVFLIAGWLLSLAGTPANLAHLVAR